MKKIQYWIPIIFTVVCLSDPWATCAAEQPGIPLPHPRPEGGRPLMETLRARQSIREYRPKPLPISTLAELLWAGFGVNRPENGHRTAPSAMNSQEVDIYVARADGLHVYDAPEHQLKPILAEDIRSLTGGQEYVTQAPVALIFVADLSRLSRARPEDRLRYAGIDTGYISQNIYLYCASERLATVVHEIGNRKNLREKLRLRPEQTIILAQSVGYPMR